MRSNIILPLSPHDEEHFVYLPEINKAHSPTNFLDLPHTEVTSMYERPHFPHVLVESRHVDMEEAVPSKMAPWLDIDQYPYPAPMENGHLALFPTNFPA